MKATSQPRCGSSWSSLFLFIALLASPVRAEFRAGAAKVDVTPEKLPVLRNGGFLEARDDRVETRLHARALVLQDQTVRLALVIVDSCMIPRDLCDQAKEMARAETGIPRDRILIGATHTHSAPSVMNYCLGTRADPNYTKFLPGRIAQAIIRAARALEPARAGWTAVNADPFTANRRWIFRTDKVRTDPFGERTVRANMHPGYQNPDTVGPSGPEDPWLSLLSIQTAEGKPLAVLANFAMHYFSGHSGVSSDYFGLFSEGLAERVAPGDADFVGAMSQGTSGDLWWGDYELPSRQGWNIEAYVSRFLDLAEQGLQSITYQTDLDLAMAEERLVLDRRLPDQDRLDWAGELNDARGDRRPANRPEVYAEQAVYLDGNPTEEVVLQALRIGALGITAMPNEVYAITGLKIKARSPLPATFNIELANGAAGYIPPPEQHALGGYNTWPARTAGLEVQAEPKITEGILRLLEKVSGTPRKVYREEVGEYARAILEDRPMAYWRLAEFEGPGLRDISGHDHHGEARGLVAYHLPGPVSDSLGQAHKSHAIHLAGGHLEAGLPGLQPPYSVECWVWNGLPHDARAVTGTILSHGDEKLVLSGSGSASPGRLQFGSALGGRELQRRFWHHVVWVREKDSYRVHLDGVMDPELAGELPAPGGSSSGLLFGGGPRQRHLPSWEGKLDEAAVYDRALSPREIAAHYRIAAVPLPLRGATATAGDQPGTKPSQPEQLDRERRTLLETKPAGYWPLQGAPSGKQAADLAGQALHGTFEGRAGPRQPGSGEANFIDGRLRLPAGNPGHRYSVSLWFRNELPNRARPVTGYLFSRGPDGEAAREAPGDHLGIGGTHSASGRLFLFNGNKLSHQRLGRTHIPLHTWNHVVFVRDGLQVTVYLNGQSDPEVHDTLEATYPAGAAPMFVGARNDLFAPFRGSLDQVAYYERPLTAGEVVSLYEAAGLSVAEPAPARVPEGGQESLPLAAEDSLRQTHVAPGFRLELAAAEPLVRDPVALDWGPDGKLWVAEMADYPYGMDGQGKAGGRIRYLLDTDQDGYYEHSQLFLDEVNFPTSVMAWRNGVLVTAAPELFYAEDTDGDGWADKREVLFEGFIQGNQQLRVNSLRWGLDNWVYAASGGHHAGFGKTTRIKSLKTGARLTLGSRDFRFLPDEGILDPQSGPAQFGRVRDDWGNWYGVQNSLPLWHYVLEDHYMRRNPDVAAPDARFQVRVPPNPKVYQNKPPQKRFHSFDQAGRYTSACGPCIYRDDLLFRTKPGLTHAFTCEPFHNVVQHHLVRPAGVSFRGERADTDGPLDFFASADRWSRPVMARTGPDGALYVVDMYRYMIEHPDWLPQEGRDELRPHYRSGENYGRIYRIVPSSGERRAIPFLRGTTPQKLVEHLSHSNGLVRDLAHQELLHRAEPGVRPAVERMAAAHANPRVRLQALAVLDGLGLLSPEILGGALRDRHAGVRRAAVRLSEGAAANHPELKQAAAALAEDPDPAVLLQLACTLGQWEDAQSGSALAKLALNAPEDRHLDAAILSSAPAHYQVLADKALGRPGLARGLMAMAAKNPERRQTLLEQILPSQKALTPPLILDRAALFLNVLRDQNQSWASLDSDSQARLAALIDQARQQLKAPGTAVPVKTAGIKLLGHQQDRFTGDLKLVSSLLAPQNPPDLQQAARQTLADWNRAEATLALLDLWHSYAPATRQHLTGLLLQNKTSTGTLLDQMEKNTVAAVDLSPAHRQQLLNHPDKKIAAKAAAILQSASNGERLEIIQSYRGALHLTGQAVRGRAHFIERCGSCHQLEELGTPVGPDLRSITDRSGSALLTAIVDPNQNVDPRYLGYTASLANDQTLYGLITSETGNSIIMKTLDGAEHQVLRENIRGLTGSRLSLMPEGLEAGLSQQAMADLIAFVQSTAQ